ncbi:hypothetical protein D9758_005869 [Tetrapyrgos nigripes]|uniref:Dipeptidyl-peptidase V n=1 Tax=Tetrapyrgos nigripes TaxID=182062 RepID=A0A8H5G309_9AGAR|nr:hypothetical protein D9758_005869 [Tetrapyrgos nigripes]
MKVPLAWLGFGTQIPLQTQPVVNDLNPPKAREFQFKDGPNVFSPKDAIELGRPGIGIANEVGDLALVPYNQFSFNDKTDRKSFFIVSLNADSTRPPLYEIFDGQAFWITNRTLGHVVEDNGRLTINAVNIEFSAGDYHFTVSLSVGSIPTKTASGFRYSAEDGRLVFLDHVYPDGNLTAVAEHDRNWENRGNSALVYDTTPVRFWDSWVGPKSASLFSVRLSKDVLSQTWLMESDFVNLLQSAGHRLSVMETMSGYAGTFDVSNGIVAYIAPDLASYKETPTKQNVYTVDITGRTKSTMLTSGSQGRTHGPVINGDGTKIAWLQQESEDFDSNNKFDIILYDLETRKRISLTSDWDRSAESLAVSDIAAEESLSQKNAQFSEDGKSLYFTAGDHARNKAFLIPISDGCKPLVLTHGIGSVDGLQSLPNGRLLFTKSSYTSPNDLYILSGLQGVQTHLDSAFLTSEKQITHFTESDLRGKNLSPGEQFWFKGADDLDVQGWVIKPPGWEKEQRKKWPVMLQIHGGPQSAWVDQWSTRWNPNVFAQQGYFCILINPTGSTTFGQNFTRAINGDWGGRPFVDLQEGWKLVVFAEDRPARRFTPCVMKIDPERAVAAGGSWGGYAINWIQGHPEYEFGFKAVFAHDGVFNALYDSYAVDIPFFFTTAFGGLPWNETAREVALKNSPSSFVHKWSIPELIVHGSKDYRLPETEALAPFHALQQLGVPSRLVILPDENHFVLEHGNSLKWHYEILRWFDKYL